MLVGSGYLYSLTALNYKLNVINREDNHSTLQARACSCIATPSGGGKRRCGPSMG